MFGKFMLRYLPNEDSQWAEFFRQLIILLRICKGLAVIVGGALSWQAWLKIAVVRQLLPPKVLTATTKAIEFFWPFFLDLVNASFEYLASPIAWYLLIAVSVKSLFWRKFWCLVGVSWSLLVFIQAAQQATWQEYHLLPLLILQGYLFMLWLVPREIWNIIGLTISSLFGLIILILPDLPTSFDDFGIFGAILAFFLGYVNLVASLIQRAADRL